MGKGIVYSIGTEDCPCCGCQERTVGCHGKCDQYKAWDGKRQAERQERIKKTSILHEADKRKSAKTDIGSLAWVWHFLIGNISRKINVF